MNPLSIFPILFIAMVPPGSMGHYYKEIAGVVLLVLNLPLLWIVVTYMIPSTLKAIYNVFKWFAIEISGWFGVTYSEEGRIYGSRIRRTYRGHTVIRSERI